MAPYRTAITNVGIWKFVYDSMQQKKDKGTFKVMFLTRVCILQKLALSLVKFIFTAGCKQRCNVQMNTKSTAKKS
jgi:hypothetical protein